jgi:hypothetical protein
VYAIFVTYLVLFAEAIERAVLYIPKVNLGVKCPGPSSELMLKLFGGLHPARSVPLV